MRQKGLHQTLSQVQHSRRHRLTKRASFGVSVTKAPSLVKKTTQNSKHKKHKIKPNVHLLVNNEVMTFYSPAETTMPQHPPENARSLLEGYFAHRPELLSLPAPALADSRPDLLGGAPIAASLVDEAYPVYALNLAKLTNDPSANPMEQSGWRYVILNQDRLDRTIDLVLGGEVARAGGLRLAGKTADAQQAFIEQTPDGDDLSFLDVPALYRSFVWRHADNHDVLLDIDTGETLTLAAFLQDARKKTPAILKFHKEFERS